MSDQAIQDARLWTRQRALNVAEANQEMAREAKQMGPPNPALKIAVSLSGLSQPQIPSDVQLSSITINKSYRTTENNKPVPERS